MATVEGAGRSLQDPENRQGNREQIGYGQVDGPENKGKRVSETSGKTLTPDDAFLIHEVIDDLDAVPQLELCLLGHRQNRAYELAGFYLRQVGNPVGTALFQIGSIAGHLLPPILCRLWRSNS